MMDYLMIQTLQKVPERRPPGLKHEANADVLEGAVPQLATWAGSISRSIPIDPIVN